MNTLAKSATYYEILEVSPKASQEVIRAAYKSLMQRYHPDKNSGDAEMAQRAIIIGRAFDVLSDPAKRMDYDLELANMSIDKTFSDSYCTEDGAVTSPQSKQPSAQQEINPSSKPDAKAPNLPENETAGDITKLLILLGVILLIGIVIVVKRASSPAYQVPAHQATIDGLKAAERQWENIQAKEKIEAERKEAESKAARTISRLAVGIMVKMPDKDNPYCNISKHLQCVHYIEIPILGVIVGKNESEKFIQHIQKYLALIVGDIENALGKHLYSELAQIDGEERLKAIIKDQINLTVVGNKNNAYNPEDRGVEEVLLPESFSIH